MMALSPQSSLPKQCGSWKDLKAAYRLVNNPNVTPDGIQSTHRAATYEACGEHPVILCVQDGTTLSFSGRTKIKGLGKLKRGTGQGLMQHSTLAVTTDGRLLGVLDQYWFRRIDKKEGETRTQRRQRWRESDVWSDSARRVGSPPAGTRFVHVMDREADSLEIMLACDDVGAGFLIRAQHNRWVGNLQDKLWPFMLKQSKLSTLTVSIGKQKNTQNSVIRRARNAEVSVRFSKVKLRASPTGPIPNLSRSVFAVYLSEENPPDDCDPVDWMLLTSEEVTSPADAEQIVQWYMRRWIIEEWHRVEKEGCRLEATQLDESEDIKRLAALTAVIAVRLLRLRDLAGFSTSAARTGSDQAAPTNDSKALRDAVPRTWIAIVSHLGKVEPKKLTPRQFWITIAKQGGYIARARDGHPGWKTIWQGWYDIQRIVQGAELLAENPDLLEKCG
jgi:hypothetical protein